MVTIEQFIRTVIPSGRIILGIRTGDHWINQAFDTEIEAAQAAKTLNAAGKDIYVAIGAYGNDRTTRGEPSRKDSNVRHAYSHFLDIDVGASKAYRSVEEALDAFMEAAQKLNLPLPTIILFSGHGIRIGWAYGIAILPNVWKQMAQQLIGIWTTAGLRIDTIATGNITSGVRLPGQLNYRDAAAPAPTVLRYISNTFVNVAEFQACLNNSVGGNNHAPVTDLTRATDSHKFRYSFAEAAKHCPVLEHTVKTQGEYDDEPRWMLVLQVLACAEDGKEWIHEVSKGHPDYVGYETEVKWKQRFDEDGNPKAGPTLCSTFAASQCKTCPHRYKINTPAKLGRIQETTNDALLPDNYLVNSTGTYVLTEDDKGRKDYEKISNVQFIRGHLAYRSSDGTGNATMDEQVLVAMVRYAGREREVTYPLKCFSSEQQFKVNATSQNILDRGTPKRVMYFMSSWIEKLEAQKRFTKLGERLGWVEDEGKHGFVLPDQVYWDGVPATDTHSMIEASLHTAYACKGDLDTWRAAAQTLVDSGSSEATLAIALSFAAPLMHYTTVAGGILSLNSERSGTGKTTAMEVGASVWGSPRNLMVLSSDTANSVLGKISRAPNMPVYWDEIITSHSSQAAHELIDRVFRISQGRERSRMRTDRSIVSGGDWNTLMCVAANYSLMDTLRSVKSVADADMMRLVEISVPALLLHSKAAHAIHQIHSNHGHAGRVYAKFLTAHAGKVGELISEFQQYALEHVFHGEAKARFWAAIWACLKLGMVISNKLNLVTFNDTRLLATFVGATALQVKEHREAQAGNCVDILMMYITRSREHYASFTHQDPNNPSSTPVLREHPRIGASADILNYLTFKRMLIATSPFREWLTSRSYNATAVIKELRRTSGCKVARTTFGRGSPYTTGRQQFLIVEPNVGEFKQAGFHELL